MAFSHAVATVFSQNSGAAQQFSNTVTGDGESNVDVVIAAAASNFSVVCPVDVTNLKSAVIWTDAAMTVVTKDSGGSTIDTFVFVANNPLLWNEDSPYASPFSATDIATLSVSSTPGGNLHAYFLVDA